MKRRQIVQIIVTGIAALFAVGARALGVDGDPKPIDDKVLRSPHADAIALVLGQKGEEIAKAEIKYFQEKGTDKFKGPAEKYWWNDVLTRKWTVLRPFVKTSGPELDMGPIFLVTYTIEDTEVKRWAVDIRRKEVRSNAP